MGPSARVDGLTERRILLCMKTKPSCSINSRLRYILGYPQSAHKHTLQSTRIIYIAKQARLFDTYENARRNVHETSAAIRFRATETCNIFE